jgi:hypothetical protein
VTFDLHVNLNQSSFILTNCHSYTKVQNQNIVDMGQSAAKEAIKKSSPGSKVHTNDGLHFITFNLDSNNDGDGIHPSSLLFVIGLTMVGVVLIWRLLRCIRKQQSELASKFKISRRQDENDVEMGQVGRPAGATAAQAGAAEPEAEASKHNYGHENR